MPLNEWLIISVIIIILEDAPPPTPLMESVEDNYITNTSAPPSSVVCGQSKALLGISVESAVISVLKAIEVKQFCWYSTLIFKKKLYISAK